MSMVINQEQSCPKDIARNDIMKLKDSRCMSES